jgi:hypothetical protein
MSASLPRERGENSAHNSRHGLRQRAVPNDPEDEWRGSEDGDNMDEDEDALGDDGEYHGEP